MDLTLRDRLLLGTILPGKGKFEDLIVRDDILKKVGVKQEEVEKYGIKQQDRGGLTWKQTDDVFPTEFTELESSLIKKSLKELSDKGELATECVTLYRSFVV